VTVERIEPMTEAPDMPLTPGDSLFEYRITRALGQGAFGTVYPAQDTLLDR
jgi:serine/threonine protein kinase